MKIEVNSAGKQYLTLINKTVKVFFKNIKIADETNISFNFVSSAKIKALNKKYRGFDKSTDVLSFPIWENLASIPKKGAVNLGDVFICKNIIQKNAEEEKVSFDAKLSEIISHSLNHLIGKHH